MSSGNDNHYNAVHYDVVIIGLGPTGAMMANFLGLQGIRTLVLEREPKMYDLPRAVHFDDEIMRAFQSVGISQSLSKKVIVNKGMRFCDYAGRLLLDWPREQQITKNGWHASYRLHQPDLETELRANLEKYPHVTVKLGCKAMKLVERDRDVEILYQPQEGKEETVSASYIVGCDGARSLVRRAMDVEMEHLGFEQRWLVIDVILKREMPGLDDRTIQYCDPVRPATYCRNPGLRRRWEFALREDESDAQMTERTKILDLISHWISPDDATLERTAIYLFQSCVAQKWNKKRLFLAGDAAHLTPPFMGQGMCAGIRDACNLSWKLAEVCLGNAPEELLRTYESERKPNAVHYIQTAVRLGELINQMGENKEVKQPVKMESIHSTLGPGLGDADDRLRGQLFPQFELPDSGWSDDFVGFKPFRVSRHGTNSQDDQLVVFNGNDDEAVAKIMDDLGVNEVLVRPDRYILASAIGNNSCAKTYQSVINEAGAPT
ncbi:MAG: bifunctional 3-(3-hydroxy-phenyl)propionate/3-hydroxycinnamic acid hydroxylase [Rhizobiaceae bacterium]|nr:bifunctional 3-(3-hydroxy-phenyl)propionate/3-hydroxycinnamic acid hydroxylase [Rhizobiaceae bacterium]